MTANVENVQVTSAFTSTSEENRREAIITKSTWSWIFLAAIFLAAGASATGWFVNGFYAQDGQVLGTKGRYGDLVALSFVVPLGLVVFVCNRRSKIWAGPAMLGVIAYLGFKYGVLAFQYHENALFVLYAALVGISLLLGCTGLADISKVIPTPRKSLSTRLASFILLLAALSGYRMWLSDVIGALVNDTTADSLEGTDAPANAARVIDMSIMLPLAVFGSIRLWSHHHDGLLVSAMMSTFFVLIGTTVLVMEAGLSKETGIETETGILVGFGSAVGLSLVVAAVTYTQIVTAGSNCATDGEVHCIEDLTGGIESSV